MDSSVRDEAQEDEDRGSEKETKGYGKAGAVGVSVVAYYRGDEGCGRREVSGGDYDELIGGILEWWRTGDGRGRCCEFGKARDWTDVLVKCTYLGGSKAGRLARRRGRTSQRGRALAGEERRPRLS